MGPLQTEQAVSPLEAQASWAHGLPIGDLIPGVGPTGIIPGGGGPINDMMGRPPMWGTVIMPKHGGVGDWGGGIQDHGPWKKRSRA